MREELFRNATLTWRATKRNRGFTAIIVLSLGLGVGLNTAIFTLIDKLVLEPLPVPSPEQLVLFDDGSNQAVAKGGQSAHWQSFNYAAFDFFREQRNRGNGDEVFESLTGFEKAQPRVMLRVDGGADPELITGQLVAGDYFATLRTESKFGRVLTTGDDRRGAPPAAVLSYYCWLRRFKGDPSLVGRSVFLNDISFTVVGVARPEFNGERVETPPDFWAPLSTQPLLMNEDWLVNKSVYWLNLLGRLKPGVSLARAQAALNVQLKQFLAGQTGENLTPERRREISEAYIELKPGARGISSSRTEYREPLYILMGVVALVLLICCANVSNVLLAHAASRRRDMSLRAALGASRGQLVRQVLTESAVLVGAGSVVGIVLACSVMPLLIRLIGVEGAIDISPNAHILIFTVILSAGTALLVGALPSLYAAQTDLITMLKESSIGKLRGRRGMRLGNALVAIQMGISLLLVVAATLLIHSMVKLKEQDLGFRTEDVLILHTDFRLAGYKSSALGSLYRTVLERISAIPGVQSASLATFSPMCGFSQSINISVPGYLQPRGQDARVTLDFVGPGHFSTLSTPVFEGREINEGDTRTAQHVAVVNEVFANTYFPGKNAVGRHFSMSFAQNIEIAGVAKNAKYADLREDYPKMIWLPVAQAPGSLAYVSDVEVRTAGDPHTVAKAVSRAISDINHRVPLLKTTSLRNQVDDSLYRDSLLARLSLFFAVLALMLAGLGMYGVVSYTVVHRKKEIGARLALGARFFEHLLWVVLKDMSLSALSGAALGGIIAYWAAKLLAHFLFGVGIFDTSVISYVFVSLVGTFILAIAVPVIRLFNMDPLTVLRED